MSKDYSRFSIEHVGEGLNKREFVFKVVEHYISQHAELTLPEVCSIFKDEVQGKKGFIRTQQEINDVKRFHKLPLQLSDGTEFFVSNQWGENIENFIVLAKSLGYVIEKSSNESSSSSTEKSVPFDIQPFEQNFPYDFVQHIRANRSNLVALEQIDLCLEASLEDSARHYGVAKVFEALSNRGHEDEDQNFIQYFDYYSEEYDAKFAIHEDPSDLFADLSYTNLVHVILEREGISSVDSADFRIIYPAYLKLTLEKLAEMDDAEMLAEFIVSQSLNYAELQNDDMGDDWLADLVIDLLELFYGEHISADAYQNEITIDGSYFGISMDSGYDYIAYAGSIIQQVI
jgi:hypothetical protein